MRVKQLIKLILPPLVTNIIVFVLVRLRRLKLNKNGENNLANTSTKDDIQKFLNKLYKVHFNQGERFKHLGNIEIFGIKFDTPDFPSFYDQIIDVLTREHYNMPFVPNEDLVIYDCGANIGTVTLYLKQRYPNARIKCFEADPKIVKYLRKNIDQNSSLNSNVEIIPKAVWKDAKGIRFNSEGADGGSIFNKTSNDTKLVNIPTVRLADLIKNETKIDLLKIDIEGAEGTVIPDCSEYLYKVKYLIFEYHAIQGKENDLGAILSVLEKNKFRYYIKNHTSVGSFLFHNWKNPIWNNIDMILIIYSVNTRLVQ